MVILLSFLVSAGTGFLAVSLLWPRQYERHFGTKFWISLGAGLGLSSWLYFLWAYFFERHVAAILWIDLAFLGFLAWFYMQTRRGIKEGPLAGPKPRQEPFSLVFYGVFLLICLLATVFFLRTTWLLPHGEIDGWAIWKMHARFLYLGGEHWKEAYRRIPLWSHPDYPLLLPGLICRAWQYAGNATLAAAASMAFVYGALTTGLLISSLSEISRDNRGVLAGIVLVGTPFFVWAVTSQFADVTLSFYLLSSLVLWDLANREAARSANLFVLSGIMAGFSAWTKSEGLLICVAIPAAACVFMASKPSWAAGKRLVYFIAGWIPMLVTVLFFKWTLAPQNTTFYFPEQYGGKNSSPLELLSDPSRHFLTLKAIFLGFFKFGSWTISVPALLLLYLFLHGARNLDTREKQSLKTFWLALGLILAGYELVSVLIPLELESQLRVSISRLLMQLWPSFLFCVFRMLRSPLETKRA